MSDDYSREELIGDLHKLIEIGLIEVQGINEEGQWIYGPTQKAVNMSEEERREEIHKAFE
jgi:hypothetical protein